MDFSEKNSFNVGKKFSDIVGHLDRVEQFKEGVQKKVFSGSYLFFGPKGVGKCTSARVLAKSVICSGLRDDFCECETCSLFPNIPDYLEISLPPDKETIGVDDISSVREFLSLYPFQGEKRVLLIDEADRLTTIAANDLLKVVEELNGHNMVVLVSSKPERVLPTLRSRLQTIRFNPLGAPDILDLLKKRGVNGGRLREIGGVSPFLSHSLLTDVDKYLDQQAEAFFFVKNFGKKKEDEILKKIDEVNDKGELLHFTEMLVVVLTDLLKLHYDSLDFISTGSKIDTYEEIYRMWSLDLLFVTIDSLRNILSEQERTIHPNLKHRVKNVVSYTYLRSQVWKP